MELHMNLHLTQSQKILLTPQLEYSLKILKISQDELIELIEEEMTKNPLLEYSETYSNPSEKDFFHSPYQEYNKENYINQIPDSLTIETTLSQHLMTQLHTKKRSSEEVSLCEFLIESIDANGYLTMNGASVASLLGIDRKKVMNAIKTLQQFEPPGIGAIDLKECLLLQMERRNSQDPIIIKLIQEHLEDIARNKIPYLAKKYHLDQDEINQKIHYIKNLDPRPGNRFSKDKITYIKPDAYVIKNGEFFDIFIHQEKLSSIHINSYYSELMANNKELDVDELEFLNKYFQKGTWLINCIDQRYKTLERVVKAIVLNQMDFFNFGKRYLKQLNLRIIADDLDLHESTISRTVNGKYLFCPWGVFELKYFFSSTNIKSEEGKEISSTYIKILLKQIIDGEDKSKPLSDNDIVELLKDKEIKISRRTIAKYRNELNIAAIHLRKKYQSKKKYNMKKRE